MAVKRAPKLDQRVRIDAEVSTSDGGGGRVLGWSEKVTVWAEVLPLSGGESPRADRLENPATYAFVIRNRPHFEVVETDRLVWGGVPFDVVFVGDYGRRAGYTEIEARRGGAQ